MAVSNIVSSLGAGSGIDIQALAQNLVDAEKTPRKDAIDAKISKSEARISGLALVNYSLAEIKTAFSALNDASDFSSLTTSNSQSSAFSVTTDSSAQAGNFQVNVSQIATAQRSSSGVFTARDATLNGGTAFDLTLTMGDGAPQTITVTTATPAGVVSAINGADAGVTAQLLNTGDPTNPYTIVVSGQTGSSNQFSISSADVGPLNFGTQTASDTLSASDVADLAALTADVTLTLTIDGAESTVTVPYSEGVPITPDAIAAAINAAGLGVSAELTATGDADNPYALVISGSEGGNSSFSLVSSLAGLSITEGRVATNLAAAQNANFKVDGLSITRSTNTISDVIPGVTLELYAATSGSGARVDLNRDSSGIEEKLNTLVTAYNDFMENMKILGDQSSDVETYGGAMAGDRFLSTIKAQVRQLVMGSSSTPGATLNAARDVGIDIDRDGVMSLDTTKLQAALSNHFDDVVTLFSADTNNQSIYSPMPGGLAGDAVKKIDEMLRSDGAIAKQTDNTNAMIERQKAQLATLEERMNKLLERYTKQFSAMDALVSSLNSQRTSLESSFKSLAAMYNNGN